MVTRRLASFLPNFHTHTYINSGGNYCACILLDVYLKVANGSESQILCSVLTSNCKWQTGTDLIVIQDSVSKTCWIGSDLGVNLSSGDEQEKLRPLSHVGMA